MKVYTNMEACVVYTAVAILSTLCGLCLGSDMQFTIPEEQPVGYFVGNVLENANINREELRFVLMKQGNTYESYFKIEEISGNLSTAGVIDREELCQFTNTCEFLLEIAVQTAKNDGFFDVVRVLVTVDDINDHRPIFDRESVNIQIPESALINSTFTIDGASDKDMSDQFTLVTYVLVPKTAGDNLPFGLNFTRNLDGRTTVKLIVVDRLDREVKDHYQFYVVAKDGGNPPLNGTLLVNVTVLDINDVYPEFDAESYNVTVKEDVKVNTVIVTLTATDADEGINGVVRYSLSPHQPGENLNHFDIDATLGELKVIQTLTPNFDSYKLIVVASNQADVSKATQTFVTVTVLDTGNNSPQVHINLLSSQKYSTISEYANIGAVVAHVAVVDHDTGRNGEVNCSVLSDLFRLQRYDVNEYKVTVKNTLDRERDNTHNVSISCDDKGVPPKGAGASFMVHIDDENDNSPTFRQQRYFANINENNEIGDRIATVAAFDLDIGNNSKISYVIPSQDSSKYVFINPSTGDVMADTVLDKESEEGRGFSLTVLAVDHGSPALTGTTSVIVTINDVNDQTPFFDQANFRFWIDENLPADTEIGWVTAKDGDQLTRNTETRFEIKSDSNEKNIPFVVFSNGNIKTNRELDWESKTEYTFEVTATDIADETLFSTASVTVFVVDTNDNDPRILMPAPGNDTVRVPYLTLPGHVIAYVKATDLDKPGTDNSKLIFSMSTLNKTNFFTIDPTSGAIRLVAPLSNADLINKVYVLKITVRDNGKGTEPATSLLRVHITADNGTAGVPDEGVNQNFVIAVAVAAVTIVISAGILVTICIIRRLDKNKKKRNAQQKVLAENMYSKGYARNNDEVDNIFPLPIDTNFMEKKKKEVSFSLDDNGALDNNQVMIGVEGQGHDSLEHILLDPPPQYQQLDIPKGKLDDSHSDMSGESAGDSGKGGSDDDLQLSGLGFGRDDLNRSKDRWDHRRSKSPGVHQMQSFPTSRYQPTSAVPHNQKIIPFSFKKNPSSSFTGGSQTHPINNLSPTTSTYSVPMYYDDETHSSSGFQSIDSSSNLNLNSHRNAGKLNLNGYRGNNDCVV